MQNKRTPACATTSVSLRLDKFEEAKLLYDTGAPISKVRGLLGMSDSLFRKFREENGWPLRTPVASRIGPQYADIASPKKPPPESLISRIEDAIEREFIRAEKALNKQSPHAVERSARTLASLVKALAELKRMRREAQQDSVQNDDHNAGEHPRELAELRAELARRLDRLRGDRPPG